MTEVATQGEQLAEFLCSLRDTDLPADVLEMAKGCILDSLGVALVGSATPWSRSVQRTVRSQADRGTASLLGDRGTAPLALAALANGTSGHSLDYDDDNAQVHVGAAVVPTALAVAEHVGASGIELVKAVVVGYEAAVRVGWAFRPEVLHERAFHPTGVCNPFGCTAAAGLLLGLSPKQLGAAFGIVGSMAAGVSQFFEDGTMTKRLHAGQSAESGVNASLMALEGFTGPLGIFEGRLGVCKAFAGGGHPEAITADLGRRFLILETAQKSYPINFAVHAPIDGVLHIMEASHLAPDDIVAIRAGVRPMVADHIGHPTAHAPQTVLAAQMSLPYGVAVAMMEKTFTLDNLEDSWLHDPKVLEHAAKVTVEPEPRLDHIDGVEEGSVLPVDLVVTDKNGQEHRHSVMFQHGDPRDPLGPGDLDRKFLQCASRLLTDQAVDELLTTVHALETTTDVRALSPFLQSLRD